MVSNQPGKKAWSFAGIFMITLILTLPFYSADALAATVQITKNSGQAGIESYIDAKGDVWTVEALISGIGNASSAVDPKDVKIEVGDHSAEFTSCSDSPLGVLCSYISPLSDGIKEVEFPFKVIYNYLTPLEVPEAVSDGAFIRADGSAPTITGLSASENVNGEVMIDFTAKDYKKDVPYVGIQKIDISDADTGTLLQTIDIEFDDNDKKGEFNYKSEGGFEGKLQAQLEGEGTRRIKVSAQDWLGHSTLNLPIVPFKTDFVKPEIVENSLNFTQLGKFMGVFNINSKVTIDIIETTTPVVTLTSEQLEISNSEASKAVCDSDLEIDKLWHCTWENVEIKGGSTSISVTITAKDEYSNTAEAAITKSDFTADNSAPKITFLGTERVFGGESYITSGKSRIILIAEEQGAGMDASGSGVLANLGALLHKEGFTAPTYCNNTENEFGCVWELDTTFSSDGIAKINLAKFEDKVENIGDMPEVPIVIDTVAPKIEEGSLEFYGVSEIGDKDYFQSGDRIKIAFNAYESSGIVVLVHVKNIILDAETKFPENIYTQNFNAKEGWQVFTEQNCEAVEGKWACEVETEQIRSGPDYGLELEVIITDTAGNEAEMPSVAKNMEVIGGKYKFDLLGVSAEDAPDYWEVQKGFPRAVLGFVDLDAARVAYTRMPFDVRLVSPNPKTKVLNMMLMPNSCVPVAESSPEISRMVLYGGNYPDGTTEPKSLLILEFAPFDGRTLFNVKDRANFAGEGVEYVCKVMVYSAVGKNAVSAGEVQNVRIIVPFAFSELGAIDENLAGKIKDIRDVWWMDVADTLHYLNAILDWARYIFNILTLVKQVIDIMDIASTSLIAQANVIEKTGASPIGAVLRGACVGPQVATEWGVGWTAWIQVPLSILTCSPDPSNLGWYGEYQQQVLNTYNFASTRDILGIPATSLYDNVYTSLFGLCIPGLIYNLEKLREIKCRQMVCYGKEVPLGIATLESCDKLYDLMFCEFFAGPAVDFILLGGTAQIGKMIKAAFQSPLGLITLSETILCANFCYTDTTGGALFQACKVSTYVNKALSIIDTVIGAFQSRPDITGSPYCSMADEIKVSELAGGSNYGGEQAAAEEEVPATISEQQQPAITTE